MGAERTSFRRLASSVGIYAAAGLAQQGVGFLLIPVYTRLIDPGEYGVLEILNVFSSIAFAVLMLGMASAINKCYHRDCASAADQDTVLPTALLIDLPLVLVGGLLLLAFPTAISRWLVGSEAARDLIPLVVVTGICSSIAAMALASLRAQERALAFSLLTFVQFIIGIVLNIVFVVVYRMGVPGILWGNLISNAALFILAMPLASRGMRYRINPRMVGPLLRFGLYLIPVLLAGWTMDVSDRYLLRLYHDLDQVAIYGVGYKFGMIPQIAVVWPFQLAWPAFSFAISHDPGHKTTYARTLTYLTTALVFVVLGISLLTRAALPAVVGAKYRAAYQVVPLVATAYALQGIHYCVSPGVHLSGNTRYLAVLAGLSAALNLALSFLLIPSFGMLGAAWATLLAFLFLAVTTALLAQWTYPVSYEYGRLAKVLVAGAAVFFVVSRITPGLSVLSLVWYVVLPLLAFPLLAVLIGFFDRSELMALRAFWHRGAPQAVDVSP